MLKLILWSVIVHLPSRQVGVACDLWGSGAGACSAHIPESGASRVGVFVESGSTHSLLVLGVERSEHRNANAKNSQIGLEDEEEDGGGHGASDVAVEIDGGDVDKSEHGTDDTAAQVSI